MFLNMFKPVLKQAKALAHLLTLIIAALTRACCTRFSMTQNAWRPGCDQLQHSNQLVITLF